MKSSRVELPNRRLRIAPRAEHLLDVKMRAATARRQRLQKASSLIWKIVLLACLATASYLGVTTGMEKFFFQNPEYTLRHVSMTLDNVLTREDVLSITDIHEGENIFSVNLAKAENALRATQVISDVHIERNLPDQIAITITARTPVAWIAPLQDGSDPYSPENALLVDADGGFMKPKHILSDYYRLPVIYGVRTANIRNGELLDKEDLHLALALLDKSIRNTKNLLNIRTLDISKGYCITVVNDRNAKIIFDETKFDEQLARLRTLLEHCQRSGQELKSVNLMVQRNTPVTFLIASAPTASDKEPPHSQKVRKQLSRDE